MTELTTLDRLKVCRATGAAITLEPEAVHELIAMIEERDLVQAEVRVMEFLTGVAEREARFLRGLVVVTALILLGGFVGLWMAA